MPFTKLLAVSFYHSFYCLRYSTSVLALCLKLAQHYNLNDDDDDEGNDTY